MLVQRPERAQPAIPAPQVEAGDLIPARLRQLAAEPPLQPAAETPRREKATTAAAMLAIGATAALPCPAFAAAIDRLGQLW